MRRDNADISVLNRQPQKQSVTISILANLLFSSTSNVSQKASVTKFHPQNLLNSPCVFRKSTTNADDCHSCRVLLTQNIPCYFWICWTHSTISIGFRKQVVVGCVPICIMAKLLVIWWLELCYTLERPSLFTIVNVIELLWNNVNELPWQRYAHRGYIALHLFLSPWLLVVGT